MYLIRPTRPASVDEPTDAEVAILGEHFAYLQQGCADGTIVLAGPSIADGGDAVGIVVLEVGDEDTARGMMESDPAIVGGVMTGELRPLRLSVVRGRE
jgi:uncharacterized protein YciI